MLTIPANQMGAITIVTGFVMALTSGLGAFLNTLAFFKARPQYFNWTVRVANLVLLIAGVVLAELTAHTFNLDNWIAYVSYALQAFGGTQLLYTAVTARLKQERNAAQAAATTTPVTNPNAGGLNSPVTFQPAGAAHDQH